MLNGRVSELRFSSSALDPVDFLTDFETMGFGLPGTEDVTPSLGGIGGRDAGGTVSLFVAEAVPNAAAFVGANIVAGNIPVFGTTFVPEILNMSIIALPTDAQGVGFSCGVIPLGIPGGTTIFLQGLVYDLGSPLHYSMTNALRIDL